MKQQQVAWGIVTYWTNGREYLFNVSVRSLRKDAIADHVRDHGQPWSELRKKGHRATKLTITWDEVALKVPRFLRKNDD